MDMALNFACSVAPLVQLNKDGATATAAADLTLLVKTDTGPLPVACIGMVSKGNCGLLEMYRCERILIDQNYAEILKVQSLTLHREVFKRLTKFSSP